MTTLVTGGAGTLGSNIIRHISDQNESIHVVDNFSTGSKKSLNGLPNVTIHDGSVGDFEFMEKVFKKAKPRLVIHLAASYRDPDDWQQDIQTNVQGMSNTLKLSMHHGVKKFINVQTVLCYGRPTELPIPESAPTAPESSYAITKTAAEQLLILSGVPFLSIRLGSVISPGLAIGPIPTFYQRIKAGLTSKVTSSVRDFLDIQDFLAFLDIALAREEAQGIFNVSSGVGIPISEIYRIVAAALKSDMEPTITEVGKDDIPAIVLDPTKARELLGWKSKVPLEESINRCIQDYDLTGGVQEVFSHLRGDNRN